jgi:hypothetical protein
LLIGGPNQSHKVNFKELPTRGKVSNKKFRLPFVNPFFRKIQKENLGETVEEIGLSPPLFRHVFSFRRRAVLGGSKENSFPDSVNIFPEDFLGFSEKILPKELSFSPPPVHRAAVFQSAVNRRDAEHVTATNRIKPFSKISFVTDVYILISNRLWRIKKEDAALFFSLCGDATVTNGRARNTSVMEFLMRRASWKETRASE